MATFPTRETDIVALGERLLAGLESDPASYPRPPAPHAELVRAMACYVAASKKALKAQAAAVAATAAKDDAFGVLKGHIKDDLRYAEYTAKDEADLKKIGWGRPGHTPRGTALPGPPRKLRAVRQGRDWILLRWSRPDDSRPVAVYNLQRRLRPDGPWTPAEMTLNKEAMLSGQERGKEWEYRVIAVNKTGESPPSNTVMAVL